VISIARLSLVNLPSERKSVSTFLEPILYSGDPIDMKVVWRSISPMFRGEGSTSTSTSEISSRFRNPGCDSMPGITKLKSLWNTATRRFSYSGIALYHQRQLRRNSALLGFEDEIRMRQSFWSSVCRKT
jgi:hypothetical protein